MKTRTWKFMKFYYSVIIGFIFLFAVLFGVCPVLLSSDSYVLQAIGILLIVNVLLTIIMVVPHVFSKAKRSGEPR